MEWGECNGRILFETCAVRFCRSWRLLSKKEIIFNSETFPDWPMTTDREELISKLAAGDIFHASFSNEAVRMCIVTSVNSAAVMARAVTT
jgi:hypothetical protein